jgi:NAD-dependent SIR2 family protein deacetylase
VQKAVSIYSHDETQHWWHIRNPSYDDDKMKKKVLEGHIPRCENAKCKGTETTKRNGNQKQEKERGLVKPDIVFFGEGVSYASRTFFTLC